MSTRRRPRLVSYALPLLAVEHVHVLVEVPAARVGAEVRVVVGPRAV